MKKHGLHYFSFLLVFLSMVSLALAEWINLTGAQSAPNIAEIHVEDDHIRLVLEIYVGDLDKFGNLKSEIPKPQSNDSLTVFSYAL